MTRHRQRNICQGGLSQADIVRMATAPGHRSAPAVHVHPQHPGSETGWITNDTAQALASQFQARREAARLKKMGPGLDGEDDDDDEEDDEDDYGDEEA